MIAEISKPITPEAKRVEFNRCEFAFVKFELLMDGGMACIESLVQFRKELDKVVVHENRFTRT